MDLADPTLDDLLPVVVLQRFLTEFLGGVLDTFRLVRLQPPKEHPSAAVESTNTTSAGDTAAAAAAETTDGDDKSTAVAT